VGDIVGRFASGGARTISRRDGEGEDRENRSERRELPQALSGSEDDEV
jgi:hypothetical protein